MSKYVKNLLSDHYRDKLGDVSEAILVNVIGLDANANNLLRTELAQKGIQLMVIKNSLATRATNETPLGPLFKGLDRTAAVCWGCEDIVSLAKEIVRLAGDSRFDVFEARGGVLDGEWLGPEEVVRVSKWPSRLEQISIIAGQINAVGGLLVSQLTSTGGALASQISQKGEEEGEEEAQGEEEAA